MAAPILIRKITSRLSRLSNRCCMTLGSGLPSLLGRSSTLPSTHGRGARARHGTSYVLAPLRQGASATIRQLTMSEMNRYQICTNCVMDTSDSKIMFDERGVCDHCDTFHRKIKPNWHTDE